VEGGEGVGEVRWVTRVLIACLSAPPLPVARSDVKPENILLEAPDSARFKLADFGLSQLIGPNGECVCERVCVCVGAGGWGEG
jgi:serine/threonine protein kinase